MKAFRNYYFTPLRKTCPDCKRKLKYVDPRLTGYSIHLLAYHLSKEYDIRIRRANIKGIAKCKCNVDVLWFDFDSKNAKVKLTF